MAALSGNLRSFFTAMELQGGVVVKDFPKFDLDTYIQNYTGRTRYDRLLLIGQSSVPLCIEALKAAVAEARKGRDVRRYRDAVSLLRQASPHDPDANLDRHWVEATEKANRDETRRLEQELNGYRNNLVRESIRMGNEDIGKHLEAIGDLPAAEDAFSRMRPDVSTSKQIVDVAKHLVRVSLQRRDWPTAINQVNKIAGLQSQCDDATLPAYVNVIKGVALLGQGRLIEAVTAFLAVNFASLPAATYADVLSPNDVAAYATLLSLAALARPSIQAMVLENHSFRPFLETEPHMRRAITMFVNGRYSDCLAVLEDYRSDFLLDLYLQQSIPKIYTQIRSKCISQYMMPFSCVTLDSLNRSFAVNGESIEEELVAMIKSGVLNARIDTIDKLVIAKSVKSRVKMQMAALQTAREYEREAIERVRRINIAAADLEVRMPRRHGDSRQATGSASAMADEWFDDSTIMAM